MKRKYRVIGKVLRQRIFSRITPSELHSLIEDRVVVTLAIRLLWNYGKDNPDTRSALRILRKLERELRDRIAREFLAD